ncbi:MAG TPA: L-aspartate oxidase [Anaerolineae bacterium]|nr:L-aspartate oxidase [Anaerolineae bacterium]
MSYTIQTDVLIIGCGIAGGTAALTLANAGVTVTVITRARQPEDSNTYWAQGGIVYRGQDDSAAQLVEDVLHAGAGHCYPPSVQILAEEGPDLIDKILIEQAGVSFDQADDNSLALTIEAAHNQPRIIHVADATGKAIEINLLNTLQQHPNVRLLTGHTAIDLLTLSHHALDRLAVYQPRTCVGAYVLNQDTGAVLRCLAKKTVLASGGIGQIFQQTSNPKGARGDGLAMAYRAGARVINCEFVQFHPTTFHDEGVPNFLISEAVRGAGARLVHANGQPFMQKYDPEWKDLAPRDVVARSIHNEMLEKGVPHVFLDLRSFIAEETIRARFPSIGQQCWQYGVDITRDLVPVVPAAHYFCGGVWVDEWGQTTIQQLYAVGEVSCTGVHGANRLASTSLLEGLVWGERAGRHIKQHLATTNAPSASNIPMWREGGGDSPDPVLVAQDMSSIKQIMWNYVGLVRTTPRLARALRELRHLETEIEEFYRIAQLTDELIGLRNAVRAAIVVTNAAWSNKQSMGCHYRI